MYEILQVCYNPYDGMCTLKSLEWPAESPLSSYNLIERIFESVENAEK